MTTLRILCIAIVLYQVQCCTKKQKQLGPQKGNVWQRLVGKDITTSPYSGSGDHPVPNGGELACNFDSSCCWSNANQPTDDLDWETVSGTPEGVKMKRNFDTDTFPNGNALGVGTETGVSGSPHSAQLYSCPVQCAQGPWTVSLNHWQTKDVLIEVCQEDSPDGPLSNCVPLQATSGSVESVDVPGGANKRIVINSNGFTESIGSIAMIDDINVKTPCGNYPCVLAYSSVLDFENDPTDDQWSQALFPDGPSTKGPPPCTKIACNFEEGNPCSYTNAQGSGGNKQWDVVQSPYQNPLTGVPVAAEGTHFAGVYLAPHDSAELVTDVAYPENYLVRFFGYRATEGVDLSACCGSTDNCPYSTTNQVQVSDFKSWKPATIQCPQGTNKVIFQAKNSGKNFGAAGLDNINLLVPGGGDNGPAAC